MPVNLMIAIKKENEEKPKQAVSIDLSGGGFCLISRGDYAKDEIVSLDFELTNGLKFENLKSIVRWQVKKVEHQYEYGIEFVDLDAKVREQLISYLFELQRNRKTIK